MRELSWLVHARLTVAGDGTSMIASQRPTPAVRQDGGGDAILYYCHHSMGLGHLVRSLAVAGALAERNRVLLCSGGRVPACRAAPGCW